MQRVPTSEAGIGLEVPGAAYLMLPLGSTWVTAER
jgi:hypothetical protein